MSEWRLKRVESQLLAELATLILSGEVRDPRISQLVTVLGVTVTKDLKHAKVRVGGFLEPAALERAVAGLNNASGFMQSRIGRRLKYKYTPQLTFVADLSVREGYEVTRRIEELDR